MYISKLIKTIMTHTEELQKELSGFELFILSGYDAYLEKERKDDVEYGTGIAYGDRLEDFYSWVDMLDWQTEMVQLVEEYAKEL
jgi:hypothetical protein